MDGSNKELISRTFMDTDFKDRTVLRLITDNKYTNMMSDFKISALLD